MSQRHLDAMDRIDAVLRRPAPLLQPGGMVPDSGYFDFVTKVTPGGNYDTLVEDCWVFDRDVERRHYDEPFQFRELDYIPEPGEPDPRREIDI